MLFMYSLYYMILLLYSVPRAVTSLRVTPHGVGSLNVTWQRPSSPYGNITGYRLTWTSHQGNTDGCSVYQVPSNQVLVNEINGEPVFPIHIL